MAVKNELERMGLSPLNVTLGEVELARELTASEKLDLNDRLLALGFEIIDDKKSRLIEQVKSSIIELVHHQGAALHTNLSAYLSQKLHHDYTYISNLFSEVEGITIEKYFIAQKIERVKELLVYDELTLNEIAFQLNYSSAAHLSAQFKKVTGLTPGHFKQIKAERRKPLDKL
jgi:AraC-like DNA-binding protein